MLAPKYIDSIKSQSVSDQKTQNPQYYENFARFGGWEFLKIFEELWHLPLKYFEAHLT